MKNYKDKEYQLKRYRANKQAKVGETIQCTICCKEFVKKQYSQAFCCSKCKDKWHNDMGDRHRDGYYDLYDLKHNRFYDRYDDDDDDCDGMTDHDWDEMFGVAEYND